MNAPLQLKLIRLMRILRGCDSSKMKSSLLCGAVTLSIATLRKMALIITVLKKQQLIPVRRVTEPNYNTILTNDYKIKNITICALVLIGLYGQRLFNLTIYQNFMNAEYVANE